MGGEMSNDAGDDMMQSFDDFRDLSDLSDLDPEFLESLEGLPLPAREGLVALEREGQALLRARQEAGDENGEAASLEGITRRRLRELFHAQQMLEFATARRDAAIRDGRAVGYSWAELAGIVGVSRQALRQRFGVSASRRRRRPG